MKLAIIADDFTGANDTGVQFAKKGLSTVVTTQLDSISKELFENDIIVFDVESRFDDQDIAYEKVKSLATQLKDLDVALLYKKVDSTFRGNIGAEIAGAMDGFDCNLAILIPALPSYGRITKKGNVIVGTELLHNTEVANDPKTPVNESFIPNIIALQSQKKVKVFTLSDTSYEKKELLESINQAIADHYEIIVFDAENKSDLQKLAACLPYIPKRYILSGSAGLAEFLPKAYGMSQSKPLLAILGSVSEITRKQINLAKKQEKITVINIDINQFFEPKYQKEITEEVIKNINQGKHTAIYTAADANDVNRVKNMALQKNISNAEMSNQIVQILGEITENILAETHQNIGSLFVTGGDALIKIGNKLGVSGMVIKNEVSPAIPIGHFVHNKYANINVITKAGAFGTEETLVQIINFIEEN